MSYIDDELLLPGLAVPSHDVPAVATPRYPNEPNHHNIATFLDETSLVEVLLQARREPSPTLLPAPELLLLCMLSQDASTMTHCPIELPPKGSLSTPAPVTCDDNLGPNVALVRAVTVAVPYAAVELVLEPSDLGEVSVL